MNVQITVAGQKNAAIIKNLYPLYLHDLSEYSEDLPNEYGILEPTAVKTLTEQGEVQNAWFSKPGILFPFLILAGGKPAGFAFVATRPYVPAEIEFKVQEFFVVRGHRGKGIAQRAATLVFDEFRGRWGLFCLQRNLRAQNFWRKVIRTYTGGQFDETSGPPIADCNGQPVFRFDNSK